MYCSKKVTFQSPSQHKKNISSVDIKHFKTERKESFIYFFFPWRTFKYVPVPKKAKFQNPKIFCEVQQALSEIATKDYIPSTST